MPWWVNNATTLKPSPIVTLKRKSDKRELDPRETLGVWDSGGFKTSHKEIGLQGGRQH